MLKQKKTYLAAILSITMAVAGAAQEGEVNVHQNEVLPELLEQKNQMVQDGLLGDRYRIQLYSGNNNEASEIIKQYRALYTSWPSTVVYETPNYKVWIGNFRNSIEADRALLVIRETFPAAFRFRPGK